MRLVRIFNIHGHISCKIPVKIWHFIASILSITCSLNSVPRHCLHPLPQSHSRAKWDQSILSTKKKIEVEKIRRISFENHYFWKSNNLRNCSELVVSLVFELLKILIFIEDTGLFQMYNIHYETTLVLLENQYFEWLKNLSKMFLLVNVFFANFRGWGLLDPPWGCKG